MTRYYVAAGWNWWDVWERDHTDTSYPITRRLAGRFFPSDHGSWSGAQHAAEEYAARLNGET